MIYLKVQWFEIEPGIGKFFEENFHWLSFNPLLVVNFSHVQP
jgi:hypothetical protein